MSDLVTARAAPAAAGGPALIAFRNVTKRFGSTVALSDVSFSGHAGSVHAITGENGAGKSTAMKLLAGVHRPNAGVISLAGREVEFADPRASRTAGISTVFQELTLLPNLTIAENLCLGREPRRAGFIDRRRMRESARAVLARIGIDLDPTVPCGDLGIAEQHLIEIAKGASIDADIFIYDEPTAALDGPGVDKLVRLINTQKASGKLVFYISHRLDEIFRLCDTVTVLKDGKHVATRPAAEFTRDSLVAMMVGRELSQFYPARSLEPATAPTALEVLDFVAAPGRPAVSFTLRRREIVGLAGLEGQGQREIIRALVGLAPHAGGSVTKPATAGKPQALAQSIVATAIAGVGFIPEDRKTEGLYQPMSIARNVGLGMLRGASLAAPARIDRARIRDLMRAMSLRAKDEHQIVSSLSGGNQQKVMIGRWFASDVDVLLIEEPTRGVDVGAKAEIYALLRDFADKGGAVLFTSSELTEHIGLSDRILVVREGAVVADIGAAQATEEVIMMHALTGSAKAAVRAA